MRSTHRSTRSVLLATLVAGSLLAACGGTETIDTTADADAAPTAESTPEAAVATTDPTGEPTEATSETAAPTVALSATPDPISGVNVQVTTTGFRFAPEHASSEPVAGEGHAHLYVDGEKVTRLYTPWYHLAGLEPGEHTVTVSLNDNDHEALEVDGAPIEASTTVTVPEPGEMMAGHDGTHEGTGMTVTVEATPDAMSGVNLHVVTTGFTWAPEHASGEHVAGEGHAHVYVDGEKVGRLYGEWMHLPLEPGEHEIEVTLNGNDHQSYAIDGAPVSGTAVVEVGESMSH